MSDQAVVAAFKIAFAQDIGTALGLPPSRITVRALAAGSVIVTFAITPDETGESFPAAFAAKTLSGKKVRKHVPLHPSDPFTHPCTCALGSFIWEMSVNVF